MASARASRQEAAKEGGGGKAQGRQPPRGPHRCSMSHSAEGLLALATSCRVLLLRPMRLPAPAPYGHLLHNPSCPLPLCQSGLVPVRPCVRLALCQAGLVPVRPCVRLALCQAGLVPCWPCVRLPLCQAGLVPVGPHVRLLLGIWRWQGADKVPPTRHQCFPAGHQYFPAGHQYCPAGHQYPNKASAQKTHAP